MEKENIIEDGEKVEKIEKEKNIEEGEKVEKIEKEKNIENVKGGGREDI